MTTNHARTPYIVVFVGLGIGNFLYELLAGSPNFSEPFRNTFFQGWAIAACYIANHINHRKG